VPRGCVARVQSSSQAPGAGFAMLAGCCARGAMRWLGTPPGAHRGFPVVVGNGTSKKKRRSTLSAQF
jgi:hypothetical protein